MTSLLLAGSRQFPLYVKVVLSRALTTYLPKLDGPLYSVRVLCLQTNNVIHLYLHAVS